MVVNEIPVSKWKRGLSVSCSEREHTGTVSGDPNQKLPQSELMLVRSLISGPDLWQASAGSSKPGASSDDWFPELDAASQTLTANSCSNWQHPQITSATMADGASWPKGARWAFWTLDSTSWIQLGRLHSVHMEGRGHIRMWGFPSLGSIPNAPWKGAVPAIQYNCGGRCRILLPGQGRGGEAEWKGSLLTLNIRVFPECCQTQHLHWHVF